MKLSDDEAKQIVDELAKALYIDRQNRQNELVKELYARFGLAYYMSEVVHRGLCNIYALLSFVGMSNPI